MATLAVCGAYPKPHLFEETSKAFTNQAKHVATKYSLRNAITTIIHEDQTLPLPVVNIPADAPIEIQLPTAADPPAISLKEVEIPSH